MRWPWASKPEKRESVFSDGIVAQLVAQASGQALASPTATAALETASGLVSRAFLSCEVKGPGHLIAGLTPAVLSQIARELIRRGECLFLLEVDGGAVRLIPAGSWDIRGGWLPESWFYRCDLFGPSGNVTKFVPSEAVTHFRYSYDPARPWLGISPLGRARLAGRLSAETAAALSDESSTSRGFLLPIPTAAASGEKVGEADDPLAPLKADIKTLGGSVAMVESTSENWGAGDSRTAPKQDWEVKRLGPRPPSALVELQSVAFREILSACGVSPSLFSETGTAAREAWRQLLFGVIQPLGKLIESELSEKLEATINFEFFRVEGQRSTGPGAGFSESCRRRVWQSRKRRL